ncbi:NAD-dependent epimerase/dehydratase family protein [Gordonia sp. (in: high G+C Gram-positive bacteria)]|uniref:NAD-dependent epimerase/dehydratase family protein n=1 Tax=Gordonia sp. (in: high G+C Gram-positive bacteria) TaxID=84139 RepID=UPI0039E6D094
MQTILGASGQIARELARELGRGYTRDLRLVSRNPQPVNGTDTVQRADLLDAEQTRAAVAGSGVVYFTAGLPPDTRLWETQFPVMLRNALDASRAAGAKFAYFDNTYMYPQNGDRQTEETPFAPVGRKGEVRAQMATMVLAEMTRGDIPVLIARAPEFYGPGRTQSFTNSLVLDRLIEGRRALVPVRDDRCRTLIWTPDASRGLAALGNAADAYGQTWHLPVDDSGPTYRQLVVMAAEVFNREPRYTVVPKWLFAALGAVNPRAREIRELLPRYAHDNLFDASKFVERFPDFAVTGYREGLGVIASAAGRG